MHSDQALAMLADPSAPEREVLGAIPYVRNEAVLHTDASLLPRRRRAWASWNCHLVPEAAGRTTITYYMNRLQSLRAEPRAAGDAQPRERIDPATVIAELPVRPPRLHPRRARRAGPLGARSAACAGTHYCGAYWRWGFHEDGVWSALRAC